MKTRRSIRVFKPEKVNQELLKQAVQAAAYAPSWKNTQVTRYIAIEDEILRKKIAEECCRGHNRDVLNNAPLLMAITLVTERSGYERDGSFTTARGTAWQIYDCGIASGLFTLAAHEVGLGSVIIGIFDDEKAAKLLDVPKNQELMSLIAVGYAAESPETPKRKTVKDLLSYR